MAPRVAVLCTLAAVGARALDALAVENPHTAAAAGAACCPAQRLPPDTLLPAPELLAVQADTFVKRRARDHLGVPVTVFSFRQPARLSHLTLPFDLALVATIDPSEIVEVPTPPREAADSWFPDYAWTHFIVCRGTSGTHQHLGWRFERKADAQATGPQTFVALIVTGRESEVVAEAAGRTRVRISAAAAQREDEEGEVVDAAAVEEVAPAAPVALPVGIEAPGWMAAMVAAVTASASRRHSA